MRSLFTAAMRRREPVAALAAALLVVLPAACGGAPATRSPETANANGTTPPAPSSRKLVSSEQRAAALRSARVWTAPAIPPEKADFKANPPGPGAFRDSDVLECRLAIRPMGGTTPKFDCELPAGEVVRVKYGRSNPELHAEIAASRLLTAIGFGADRMYAVQQVRCAGCTSFPFQSLQCLARTGMERPCFPNGVDYSRFSAFERVVIERPLEGRRIEAAPDQGWAWYELDQISAAAGGAPRSHIDALKLLALVIVHWDNKAENQRLLCLPGGDLPDGSCSRPLAIVQDLGASFGPVKLDLHNWRSTPVWADPRGCLVSMEHLPWGGGTFGRQKISEEGRRFLLERLERLSAPQLEDLFAGARVELADTLTAEARQPRAWAVAFQDKVRQIREAGPCP